MNEPATLQAYVEALSRRIPGQPEAVRRLLQEKLRAAQDRLGARIADTNAAAVRHPPASCAPLAQLNQYIRDAARAPAEPAAPGEEPPAPDELASARRFRQAWHRKRTEEQVELAVARRPANAGPLNSHVLVLQSLAMMQDLSSDYLRRFVAHVEALQWLEGAAERPPQSQPKKPVRRTRRK
jgi:hypothetical protein